MAAEDGGKLETNGDKYTHQLEVALAFAENIIATLREPFVVLDKNLRVRTANTAFYRDFHASKEETEGRFVYELGNGQWDIPQLRTLLSLALSNSHPVEDFEVEHAFPAIGRRNMLLNARRFPPETNDPDLVLLAIEDVTDRRQAEAAMEHSEVRYRRLFQMAKDGILILDADTGKVIDANPFMTALLGYSHDEFVGKELWEIGLFRDIDESRAAYRELQENGYLRYEHLPLESRSGQKVEVEFVSNVYEENNHQVVQCNIRDITERSRLQRLTQEQAAALADLDRRKDEFLAMLSHELRNPLAPILNAALLLRLHSNRNRLQGIENPILQQSATIIERQVGQLTHIVDELLEVSRITTGRIQLHQEPIALGVVVENAVSTVRSLIDQRKHELTVSLPTQAIWVHADAARLEQVVVNLLTNAAKYTDPRRSRLADSPTRGRGGGTARAGYGRRHRPRSPAPHLRPVHAGGTVAGPLARWIGHRTGFGATPRGNARGNGGGFQYFGARQRVRRASAGGVASPAPGVIASHRNGAADRSILAGVGGG